MKKIMLSLAVSALAIGTAGAAHAQDDWRSGLYIKGGGGWNQTRDQDYTGGETELDDGYALSGAVGYDYGDWRSELEITYRNNDVDSHTAGGAALANPGGDLESTAFMVNGYYDIPTGSPLTPYVGAGLGVAKVNVNDYTGGGATLADDDETVFAYQGIAGVEYAVANNFDVFTEYKYFGTEDIDVGGTDMDHDNHTVMAGVKYSFN